jgi:hypothetical protein
MNAKKPTHVGFFSFPTSPMGMNYAKLNVSIVPALPRRVRVHRKREFFRRPFCRGNPT